MLQRASYRTIIRYHIDAHSAAHSSYYLLVSRRPILTVQSSHRSFNAKRVNSTILCNYRQSTSTLTRASHGTLPTTQPHTRMSSAAAAPAAAPSTLEPLPNVAYHSPRVISVLGQNPSAMTLQGTNTYLIGTGAHRILLDTAEGFDAYTPMLRDVLKQQVVTQLTILLSHWHADHTGGLAAVCSLFDVAHQPTIYKYADAEFIPQRILTAFPELQQRVQPIVDRATFSVEGASLRAIHTPGHTLDHCVFYLEEESAVFSGDTILGSSSAVFSDLRSYMASLASIRQLAPQRIYPAHGPIISGAAESIERIDQYIAHRMQREKQIIQAMVQAEDGAGRKDGLNVIQIVEAIYPSLASNLLFAAANNVLLHLDKLQQEGVVRAIEDPNAVTIPQDHAHEPEDEDDCRAEVAKAHAIARQRATWRWQLTHAHAISQR